MVKNGLKKIKVSKVDMTPTDKLSMVDPVATPILVPSKKKQKTGSQKSTPKPVVTGNLKKRLREESQFISQVLELFTFHHSAQDSDSDDDDEEGVDVTRSKVGEVSRATSVGELHERLNKKLLELRGPTKPGKSKPKLSKAEKKQKAKEEKRLKAKLLKKKPDGQDFGSKMVMAAQKAGAKPAKPVFNSEGKMVFSKFDFTDDGGFKTDDSQKKQTLDPKSALAKLQKHKEKLRSLEEQGKSDKARSIKESTAWKTALDRSSGVKVKDDPSLLKRSIKKLERRKKVSKKKWEGRVENEEKRKQGKQQKRSENLGKRKSDKKDKAKKKAIKKGRVVPGFR